MIISLTPDNKRPNKITIPPPQLKRYFPSSQEGVNKRISVQFVSQFQVNSTFGAPVEISTSVPGVSGTVFDDKGGTDVEVPGRDECPICCHVLPLVGGNDLGECVHTHTYITNMHTYTYTYTYT